LMTSGGARQFDTNTIISRYEQRILMTVLADFIMVGHQDTGSYALHVDKTGIFRTALNSIVKSVADVFNRTEIPRLFALNGWSIDRLPKLTPTDVDPPDLAQLGAFIQQMTSAGMTFFPDQDLEGFLRTTAKLPPISPEMAAEREQQQAQQQAMETAQQQMELAQAHQGLQSGEQQMDQGDQQMEHAERGQQRDDEQTQMAAENAGRQAELHQLNLSTQGEQGQMQREAHTMNVARFVQSYKDAEKAKQTPGVEGPGQGKTTGKYQQKR
jgi:hypothetical protein